MEKDAEGLRLHVARAIALSNGDAFDLIPADKQEWIRTQGKVGDRFRDVNEPRQADYLDMADAAISAVESYLPPGRKSDR